MEKLIRQRMTHIRVLPSGLDMDTMRKIVDDSNSNDFKETNLEDISPFGKS